MNMCVRKFHYLLFVMVILVGFNSTYASGEEADVYFSNQLSKVKELKNTSIEDAIVLGEKLASQLINSQEVDQVLKVNLLNELAHSYILTGKYTEAMKNAKLAKDAAVAASYELGKVKAIRYIAHFHLFTSNYEQALSNYLIVLDLARNLNENSEIAKTLNSIAQVYNEINKSSEAVDVYKESIQILKNIGDKRNEAFAYAGLADAYKNLENYEEALNYASISVNILQELRDNSALVFGYHMLGDMYLAAGDSTSAEKHFHKCLELAKANNTFLIEARANLNLAKIALNQSDFGQAKVRAKKSLQTAQDKKELALISESLQVLSEIFEREGKLKDALEYFKKYEQAEGVIFNQQSDRNLSALRTSFEVDKLDRQNQLLTQQNELNQANIEKQRIQTNFIIVFFLLVIISLGFAYYRYTHGRKLKQEKLLNEQLQRLNEMKDQILMNTSHEFRTPLAGIIGLADCLKEEVMGPQTEEAKENLELIISSGNRLTSLVEDIINFAQLKSGNIKLNSKPVELNKIVNDVVATCTPLITGERLRINNHLSQDELIVYADEKRLSQILFNLIGNAIKYSNEGEITISAERNGQKIKVNVIDNGIGIPEDKIDSIFEDFEQIDGTTTRSHEGSGLGLAIVKRLVELHGGIIEVHSKLNQGSTFSFTLPTSS